MLHRSIIGLISFGKEAIARPRIILPTPRAPNQAEPDGVSRVPDIAGKRVKRVGGHGNGKKREGKPFRPLLLWRNEMSFEGMSRQLVEDYQMVPTD
jgi:hypothetical protein